MKDLLDARGRVLRRRSPLAFFGVAVAIALSFASVGLVQHMSMARAASLAFVAALAWAAIDGIAPFNQRARKAVSPHALGAVAVGLCLSWNITGFGLAPVAAAAATGLGVLASTLTLALARRLGNLSMAERVLIVGSGVVADALDSSLSREGRNEVVGMIDDGADPQLLGHLGMFDEVVARERVTAVVFAYSHASDARLAQIAERTRELGLTLAVVPRLFEHFNQRWRVRQVAGMRLLVGDPLLHQVRTPVLSRGVDILVAALLLVVTAPIWIIVSLAIFLEEPGAIIYRAERVGLSGRPFKMLKFRKMRRDAAGPKLTLLDDARFTRIGALLARTKLDELPSSSTCSAER